MKTLMLATLDNRSVPQLDHCYGAPFLCTSYDDATELIYKSLGGDLEKFDLELFDLVVIGDFHLFGSEKFCGDPMEVESDMERYTVFDLFETTRKFICEEFLKGNKHPARYVEGSYYKFVWDWCVENDYKGTSVVEENLIADLEVKDEI